MHEESIVARGFDELVTVRVGKLYESGEGGSVADGIIAGLDVDDVVGYCRVEFDTDYFGTEGCLVRSI